MRIEQLQQVLRVAEYKSINKAAKILYLSQPMLSQSIKSLENEIGKTIFIRTGSGVELTAFGHVFIEHANDVIKEFDSLMQVCRFDAEFIHRFRVATYPLDASRSAYIKLFGKYSGELTDFGYSEGPSLDVIKLVASGAADLGIDMVSAFETRKMSSLLPSLNLKSEYIATCPLCMVVGQGSLFFDRKEINSKELGESTLIYFGDGWEAFATEYAELGINENTPSRHASNSLECRELLESGNYYALLSRARASEFRAFAPNTKAITISDKTAGYHVQYVYNPKHPLSDTALEFLDTLREELFQERQN